MSTRWRLAVLAGLFTLVTACSGQGDDGGDGVASMSDKDTPTSSSPAKDDEEPDIDQMRKYAKCMREHGVDMADPEESGNGGGVGISVNGAEEKAKVDKANAACKSLMPNGGEPPEMTAEDLDKARDMAKCLREHGIDVKDPTMDEPGISIGSDGSDQEKVDKAMKECAPEGAQTQGSEGKPAK